MVGMEAMVVMGEMEEVMGEATFRCGGCGTRGGMRKRRMQGI